jgi:O-antigen ligase
MNGLRVAPTAGALLAGLLVAGRWSFARLANEQSSMTFEPRLWLVALLLALAFAPAVGPLRPLTLRARAAWAGWAAFYVYFTISVAWAPDLTMALDKAAELGLVAAAAMSLVRLSRTSDVDEIADSMWRTLAIVYALFAVMALSNSDADSRLAVLGGGPNVFGRNMAILGLICVDAIVRGRARALAIVGVSVAGMLVLLSGSRGAMLAITSGSLLLLWTHRLKPTRIMQAALVLLIAAVIAATFTDVGRAAVEMFRERVVRLTLEEEHDSGRSQIYDDAIALGWRGPIYGDGLAGFPARGYFVYPHNIALEAWAEGGAIGVLLLLLALRGPAALVLRRPRGAPPLELSAFVALLLGAQFSGDFFDSRAMILLGLLAVLRFERPRR